LRKSLELNYSEILILIALKRGDGLLEGRLRLKKVKNILRCITAVYFIWIIFGGNIDKLFMVWNVILAWVPLELTTLICTIKVKNSSYKLIKYTVPLLWVLWLIFYPNAPYIITDFIHISTNDYYMLNPNYIPYSTQPRILFNDNIGIWIDFINIAIGVWIGYMLGFISLYINQELVKEKYNKIISFVFVAVVQLLSGFAIYIGRFSRWNSWDLIANPGNIITIIMSSINTKALWHTFLFGMLSAVLYMINYAVFGAIQHRE
jgi:Predicted membrane protein